MTEYSSYRVTAMSEPELPSLRTLLGDAWIDAEVFAEKPTHLLGRRLKEKPDNRWVLTHTESLAGDILSGKGVKFNSEVLANKIKSKTDFVSTLAEMESAVFLAKQGFKVTLEPLAPAKGPDIQADWEGTPHFVEIRTVGFSENEDRRDAVTNEIFAKLNVIPSSYTVMLTISKDYKHGSIELRDAIIGLVRCLDELKQQNAKEAVLYYAGKNDAVLKLPDANINEKCQDIIQRANFIARFNSVGYMLPGTPASLMEPLEHPPKPSNDHERLKRILDEKRRQLPEGSRGIITLEVSEQFMLSDFSIERALYGDLIVEFPMVNSPAERVGDAELRRNKRGFLLRTSRVSAVVIHTRTIEDGRVNSRWRVYPTNRANPDTIRLTLAELKRFGDLEDREHLCAEKAPTE